MNNSIDNCKFWEYENDSDSEKKDDNEKDKEVKFGDQPRTVVATQYLTSFANKIYAYRIPCLLGLLVFNHEIQFSSKLSPLIPDFEENGLKNIEAEGGTALWDTISTACDNLLEFNPNSGTKKSSKSSGFLRRIIVISDGEDTSSYKEDLESVSKKLLKNKVTLDVVFASSTDFCKELATLSHITGGVAIKPQTIHEGMSLFEQSAFLNPNEREQSGKKPLIPNKRDTLASKLKESDITQEFLEAAIKAVTYDTGVTNKSLKLFDKNELTTPEKRCFLNRHNKINTSRERRILRELHYTALVMNKNSDHYDPELQVYPLSSNFDNWRVFMKAADEFYKFKWFMLSVTFPPDYPIEPPIICFMTVPYHLNISKEGRICLDILEKGYIPSLHVIDIIQDIKILFLIPNMDTPIQIEKLELFLDSEEMYYKEAGESADAVGKDKVEDFLKSFNVDSKINGKFELSYDTSRDVPSYMKSQISGRVIRNPVLASSGVFYERSELRQLLASSDNPICVVTGMPLTDDINKI